MSGPAKPLRDVAAMQQAIGVPIKEVSGGCPPSVKPSNWTKTAQVSADVKTIRALFLGDDHLLTVYLVEVSDIQTIRAVSVAGPPIVKSP